MSDNVRGRMLALEGLRRAAEDAQSGRGYMHVTAGTGAFWASALDDQLRRSYGGIYDEVRDDHERGQVIHGLRLARNAIAHGAHVVTHDGGFSAPLTSPIVSPPPAWVSLERLLSEWTPEKRPMLPRQEAVFEKRVAGRQPHEPLWDAVAFFDALQEHNWDPDEYVLRRDA